MAPGASILMKGLGMRVPDTHIKNLNRSRGDLDKFNRPKPLLHNRDDGNHPMPLGVHGNGTFEIPPYMTDEDIASIGTRYRGRHQGTSVGVSDNYVWRLFEHDRSQLRRQGFLSPYKDTRGRAARDEREFNLWLRCHPDREELGRMNEDYRRRYDQETYRKRRIATSHKRRPHHPHQFIDIRDPRYPPPYPEYEMNRIRRRTDRPSFGISTDRRNRHPHRQPTTRIFPTPRGTGRPPNPIYRIPGNSIRQRTFTQPIEGFYLPTRHRRPHPRIYPDLDPRTRPRDFFIPRYPRPHRRYANEEDEDDVLEEEEEDLSSQHSTHSFIRRPPSPRIVYPFPPPYHGGPLRHDRHETYTDDDDDEDDDEDELFQRRGEYMGHRRASFGLGRDDGGGRFRRGPRGYRQRGGLEYGFSDDGDDVYDYE